MSNEKGFELNEETAKRLLAGIFGPTEELTTIEMTNLFKVTDMDKFENIVEHIQNDNGVFVMHKGDKVSIHSHDTICNAVPLDVDKALVREYDGDNANTLKLLQEILPDGEMIVLQSTCYTEDKDDIVSNVIKVTNEKITTLM